MTDKARDIISFSIAATICLTVFAGGVALFGSWSDLTMKEKAERNWCLKAATNGDEIRECR